MANSTSIDSSSYKYNTGVFVDGKYSVELIKVGGQSCCSAVSVTAVNNSSSFSDDDDVDVVPRPLLIGSPSEAGVYPVLLFLHGYLLYNTFYSQLVRHIASHGFIVVAPQLYTVAGPDSTEEITATAAITNWFSNNLQKHLPPYVHPNLTKLALSGHSRGGKVAFGIALGKATPTTTLKYSALIGVGPVDGTDKGKQTNPPILTYTPHSFNLNIPVMVLGSGLGEVRKNPFFPPCAPKGVNHQDFYNECRKPACYFVVKDYGHVDMLDDDTTGIRGKATYCLCKNGKSREPMRRFVGGVMVAFLKAHLDGSFKNLEAIKNGHVVLPVELQKVDFLE